MAERNKRRIKVLTPQMRLLVPFLKICSVKAPSSLALSATLAAAASAFADSNSSLLAAACTDRERSVAVAKHLRGRGFLSEERLQSSTLPALREKPNLPPKASGACASFLCRRRPQKVQEPEGRWQRTRAEGRKRRRRQQAFQN